MTSSTKPGLESIGTWLLGVSRIAAPHAPPLPTAGADILLRFRQFVHVVCRVRFAQDFNVRLRKVALAYYGFALKYRSLLALMFEAKRRPAISPAIQTSIFAAFSHSLKDL